MPRKTPVREIQQEETTAEGSLRRSSRIAQNIVIPTKITERRNSANNEIPAKITKTKRLSFSQEDASEFVENKPSVETNVSTPKKTRLTRSASKSPTLLRELEPKSTAVKTRGRRGSLSKGIEEEVNSSTPKKTRSRSTRSESKSPLTVSDSEHVRLKTRRGSITDNITPLEKIEEVSQPTEPKKRLRSRRSSMNEMSQLDAIDETETNKKDKKLELEAISEITENEKETPVEDPNRKLETVLGINNASISQSINKLKLSPVVIIQKDKTITDFTVNQKLEKEDIEVAKATNVNTDETEKPDTHKSHELCPVKVIEQVKLSNDSANSEINSKEDNCKPLESEINSKMEKNIKAEENKEDCNLTKITQEKSNHSEAEYIHSSDLLAKVTKETIPKNITSEETNLLPNIDIIEKLNKVDIESENIKSNITEETKTVLKENPGNNKLDVKNIDEDSVKKQNKGYTGLNISEENSSKNEINIRSRDLLLNINTTQNNELEKREALVNEEVVTKENTDDKKIGTANVDEEMNIAPDTNITEKGSETKIINENLSVDETLENKNEINNAGEKEQENNETKFVEKTIIKEIYKSDVLEENADNNQINLKIKNTNFNKNQSKTTILNNESSGEKIKNEINTSRGVEKDQYSEAKSQETVEKIDNDISQTSQKVLKQISTERKNLNREEDNSELKFETSEIDCTNKSLSNLLPNQLDMTSGSDGSYHINLSLQNSQEFSSLKLSNVENELNKSDSSDKENRPVEGVKESTPISERKISSENISQKEVENIEFLNKSSQDSFYEPMDVDYPPLNLVDDVKIKSFSLNVEECSTPAKEICKSTDLPDHLSIQNKIDISDVQLENKNKAITDNKKHTNEISASRSVQNLNLKEIPIEKETVENKLESATEKLKLVNDVTENQMSSTKKSEEIATERPNEENNIKIILSNEDSLNKSLSENKEENNKDYDSPVFSIENNVQNILNNEDSLNNSLRENKEENIKDSGNPIFSTENNVQNTLSNEDSLNKSLSENKEENNKDYDSPVFSTENNVQNIDSLNNSLRENKEENIKDSGNPIFSTENNVQNTLSNEDSLNKSLSENKEENNKDYDSPVFSTENNVQNIDSLNNSLRENKEENIKDSGNPIFSNENNIQNTLSNEDSLNKSLSENKEENIEDYGSPAFSIDTTDLTDEDINISIVDGTACRDDIEKHHHTSCEDSVNSTSTTPNYVCKESEQNINISEDKKFRKIKSSSTTKNYEENNKEVEQIIKKRAGINDNKEHATDVKLEKLKKKFTESKRISNIKEENEKASKDVSLKTNSVESKGKQRSKTKNKLEINDEKDVEIESLINVEAEEDIAYKLTNTSKINLRKSETENLITEEAEENTVCVIVSKSKRDSQKAENENFELVIETTVNTEEQYEIGPTNVEFNRSSKKASNPKKNRLSSSIVGTEINNSEKYTEKQATKAVKVFNSSSENEENNQCEEANEFIDDMAEEVEDEETPSEDSNNIICEGESINSSDTNTENDDSYENDSFIDDEEDNFELLSGEEDFLQNDLPQNLKKSEVKQKTVNQEKETKKRRRIFTLSDSEDGEQLSNENISKDDNSNIENTDTTKGISTAETKLSQAEVSRVTNDIKHISDIACKNELNIPVDLVPSRNDIIHVSDSDSESSESANESIELDKSIGDSLMVNNSKRKSSITIQENIKLEDIQDGELSERISKVVDWFYTGIKNSNDKGNISLNVSLDYGNQSPNKEEISNDENSSKKENVIDPNEISIKRKSDENVENKCPKKAKYEESDDVFIDSPRVSKEYDATSSKKKKYKPLQKFDEWKNEEHFHEKNPLHSKETDRKLSHELKSTFKDNDNTKLRTMKSKRLSGEKIQHLSPKEVKYDSNQSKDFNIKLSKPSDFIAENVSSKKVEKKYKKPKIDVDDTVQVTKENESKQIKRKQRKHKKLDEFDDTEMPDEVTKENKVKMKNIKIRKEKGVSSNKDNTKANNNEFSNTSKEKIKKLTKKMTELNNECNMEINKQKNQKGTKISLYTSKGADEIPCSSGTLERHFVQNTVVTKREIEEIDKKRKKRTQRTSRKILPSKNSKLDNLWETDDFYVNPSKSNKKKSDSATSNKNKTETDSFNFKDFKNRMLYDASRIKRMDTKILLRQRKNI